jgi:predicted nucleic acid-binding protein
MNQLILLDTGPLRMVTNPKANSDCQSCKQWLSRLEPQGDRVAFSEIVDYELRRELIRAGKIRGIQQLDQLKMTIPYFPITTEVMLKAAELWAEARNQGYPTASPDALDGDVILAAQAMILRSQGYDTVIATTNVGHLSRFTIAKTWQEIA